MDSNSILTESGRNKSMGEAKAKTAKTFEKESSKISSPFFLSLAAGVIALSLGLAMTKKKKTWALFVGQWVPTILLLGVYNKISPPKESDKVENKSLLH